jgi:hypothetical protein
MPSLLESLFRPPTYPTRFFEWDESRTYALTEVGFYELLRATIGESKLGTLESLLKECLSTASVIQKTGRNSLELLKKLLTGNAVAAVSSTFVPVKMPRNSLAPSGCSRLLMSIMPTEFQRIIEKRTSCPFVRFVTSPCTLGGTLTFLLVSCLCGKSRGI